MKNYFFPFHTIWQLNIHTRKDRLPTASVLPMDWNANNLIFDRLYLFHTNALTDKLLNAVNTLSKTLSDLLALNNDSQEKPSAEKNLRDRAFTHLKVAVDKIRLYGKAEFWSEPDRLKGYSSDYYRN